MRQLIIAALLFLTSLDAFATCSTPISRDTYSPNTVLTSSSLNTQFNTVYNHVNNIDGDCVQDSSVNKAKLETGYLDVAVTSKTAAYTATSTDQVITADASGGAYTITLPTAVGITGRQYTIKKTDSSANAITVDANSAETIDGSLTISLWKQYQMVVIVSSGSNWIITNHFRKCTSELACEKIFTAFVASDDTVTRENLDWLNGNCTDATVGEQTCTFQAGLFTETPNCFSTVQVGGSYQYSNVSAISTTSVTFETRRTDTSATINSANHITCQKTGTDYTNSQL
jgi:hypothetical protein